MGGASTTITAATIEELEQKVRDWYEEAKDMDLDDVRLPWDPDRAVKVNNGYEFAVWAHS